MNLDGMWALLIPNDEEPGKADGAVLFLLNGYVYHGDAIFAGHGTYTVNGEDVSAEVEAMAYNPTHAYAWNPFGTMIEPDGSVIRYRFVGAVQSPEKIDGRYWQVHEPNEGKLVHLQKLREIAP